MSDLAISPVLHRETGSVVVRACLGFTAYLAEPAFWSRKGARRVFEGMLSLPQADLLHTYTTSRLTEWKRCDAGVRATIQEELSNDRVVRHRPRHLFSVRLADTPNCPAVGFEYTDIDATRADRSGVIQVSLPLNTDPDKLLELAMLVAETGPLHSLVGGYVARWNPLYAQLAFHRFHQWSYRYVGLDVQEPDEWAWHTPTGLPGTNWITVIGDCLSLEKPFDATALEHREFEHDVSALRLTHGLVIRAGAKPSLGDLNMLQFPSVLAEVAETLAATFVSEPPAFWGPFHDDGSTSAWLHRLIKPEKWKRYDFPAQPTS